MYAEEGSKDRPGFREARPSHARAESKNPSRTRCKVVVSRDRIGLAVSYLQSGYSAEFESFGVRVLSLFVY